MKVTPIIFNAEMIRALLDGRKTQTRRVCSDQEFVGEIMSAVCVPMVIEGKKSVKTGPGSIGREPDQVVGYASRNNHTHVPPEDLPIFCPYGQTGDLLWVKETTIDVERHGYKGPVYAHSEDGASILEWGLGPPNDLVEIEPHEVKLRPSIFMKRKWSRLTLRLTDVRVERVQEITDRDCFFEGAHNRLQRPQDPVGWNNLRCEFANLWDSINAKRGYGWDANPWVWALTFEVIKANVDEVLKND